MVADLLSHDKWEEAVAVVQLGQKGIHVVRMTPDCNCMGTTFGEFVEMSEARVTKAIAQAEI